MSKCSLHLFLPDVFANIVVGDGKNKGILGSLQKTNQNFQQFVILLVQFFYQEKMRGERGGRGRELG